MTTALAEAFPAGEYLADELEARGWTQAEFAGVLGRPVQFVSEVVSGRKEITRESAAQIGAALGTSAEFWLDLQDRFFLWRQSQDPAVVSALDEVRARAQLHALAPVAVMKARGLITGTSTDEMRDELRRLEIDADHWAVAARRGAAAQPLTATQKAWAACVRAKGEGLPAAAYSATALRGLASGLTRLVKDPSDFDRLPALFAQAGVRIVSLEAFPGSRMDGCAVRAKDDVPVIGISGRGKRLDKVLFTILHEAAHVVLGHLDGERTLIVDDVDRAPDGVESEADQLAADWVLPGPPPRIPAKVTRGWVDATSSQLGIAAIVLIGRLQSQGQIPWRTSLVRQAPSVERALERW